MRVGFVAVLFLGLLAGCATEDAGAKAPTSKAPSTSPSTTLPTLAGATTQLAVQAGASSTELGLQARIDQVHAAGGGTVQLTGAGPIVVAAPLHLYSDTALAGDASSGPFGTALVGGNDDPGGWRMKEVIGIVGAADAPIQNAQISNLDISGTLIGSAIIIQRADTVSVTHVRIQGARQIAIAVTESTGTTIQGVDVTMQLASAAEPPGAGAAIWLRQAQRSMIRGNTVTMPTFFALGEQPPHSPTTMDCIASYGGVENTIAENDLSYGNTAGIYIDVCTGAECSPVGGRERDPWVWGNTIHHFQQHGIDIANADRPTIKSNHVDTVGDSPLSLSNSHDGLVQWNVLSNAGGFGHIYADNPLRSAAVLLQRGSSRNGIYNNELSGDMNAFAVALWQSETVENVPYPDCAGNAIGGANGNGQNNHWHHGTQLDTNAGLWFDMSQDTLSNGIGDNDAW